MMQIYPCTDVVYIYKALSQLDKYEIWKLLSIILLCFFIIIYLCCGRRKKSKREKYKIINQRHTCLYEFAVFCWKKT